MTSEAIAPSQIRSELTRIWEPLEAANKMRACLFNLIVFIHKGSRVDYYKQVAGRVVEKFPCRVILIVSDSETQENNLTAKVSVLSGEQDKSNFACDLIEFNVTGSMCDRIPFVVLPHILPDLPVYLLWGENTTTFPTLLQELSALTTRVIFDSEVTDSLPTFAKSLLELREQGGWDTADLNWGRLEAWRSLLLLSFNSEDKLTQLRNAKSLEITFNSRSSDFYCHTKIPAVYLQGWIACQLGWKLDKILKENDSLVFVYHDGPMISLLMKEHAELSPGAILSVEVTSKEEYHFSFSRCPKSFHQVIIQCSSREQCELPTRYLFTKREIGQSLVREIYHPGTSEHFLTLLQYLATIEESPLC